MDDIIELLDKECGQDPETVLMVHRGKTYDYMEIAINYNTKGKVVFTMVEYIQDVLDESLEELHGQSETPAANHLFDVDKYSKKLNKEYGSIFHHLVAKLLYLPKRARSDIQKYVSFLCTQMREPDIYDWKKLQLTIRYPKATRWLPLTLEADETMISKWWIYSSYGVHEDHRVHTGGTISLGKGHPYSTSSKQKLNTRSSTESKLVGIDDLMPMLLWTPLFMEAHGYDMKDNILYQDNKITMLLDNSRKA